MKENEKKTKSAVGDNMRSNKKRQKRKSRKKCFLNESKTLQNKEAKVIEFVKWIEPGLNWHPEVSPDE